MKMILHRVMFNEIISVVVGSFVPEDVKFFLCFVISKSMTSHAPLFRSFLIDVIVNESMCCVVIRLNSNF